ncbi:MAG: hypothetical protein F6K00_25950 [Leptolyngbya sp. SIOISBB]|nr:hypothetical protein [Leptolyngbya sp. SIOISBB]
MYSLSPFTCARLQRLPKQPVIWEGDRRPIAEGMLDAFGYDSSLADADEDEASDCIIWVDGTEGVLRAVTIIPADTGHEAVVRTLLQAMEHPQGAIPPARPHKLVVCDREIHFFLRGALQDLDLTVDYAEALPIIDEIFESLQQPDAISESSLPPDWESALNEQAHQLWDNAPWNHLGDDQILRIELNQWNLGTLYVSVLGMAGLEYGLLIYRSLDSLTQFRKTATESNLTPRQMQQAFLSQDCLFLNFELVRDEADTPLLPLPWMQTAPSEVIPEFGSLHPLEGLRHTLELEEAAALRVCLQGLNYFLTAHEDVLSRSDFSELTQTYDLPNPLSKSQLTIKIATCPDITAQLEIAEDFGDSDADLAAFELPRFRDDYVPEGAMVLLTRLPQTTLQTIGRGPRYHALGTPPVATEMIPVVAIQTSRPKAQKLASQLETAQGIKAVCFNPGSDPMSGDTLQLGLLHTRDGDFHLFIEFLMQDAHDSKLLTQWQQWCADSNGFCGVMIASGVTGAARGKPGPKETIAFFETYLKTPEELNIPPLQMSYALDWE